MAWFEERGVELKIEKENSIIIFCKHPNIENTHLVFPVIGDANETLFNTVIITLQRMGSNVQLARFEHPPFQKDNNNFVAVTENILDWTYPVHTLDTALVCNHIGTKFQCLRTGLNKLKDKNVQSLDLDPEKHKNTIIHILNKWSPTEKQDVYFHLLDLY